VIPRPAVDEPALKELRRARRRNRVSQLDWADALYQAYLAGVTGIVVVVWVSGFVTGDDVSAHTVQRIIEEGPAWAGLLVAVALAMGFRAGGRGGPLALEDAEVMHVLLSPVDRGAALVGPALRQIRTSAFIGAIAGVFVGQLALRRMPGNPATWMACLGLFGILVALGAVGAALIASGTRWRRWVAGLVGVVLIGGSIADLVYGTTYSPATLAGKVIVWPLEFEPLALLGAVALLLLPLIGIYTCGGTALEAAKRRAGLQAQLRFAATLYDVRTVILLRRQLAQELSRNKPWVRLPIRKGIRFAPIRRGLQGLMRWPGSRILRLFGLGAVVGFACLGAWNGVKPLILVAGGAMYVAALDAVEPLAQEGDHPHLGRSLPIEAGRLRIRHMILPTLVMMSIGLFGAAVIMPFGDPATVMDVTAALLPCAALAAVCGAALSVTSEPAFMVAMRSPSLEMMGMHMMLLITWPPAVAVIGVAPLLGGITAFEDGGDIAAAIAGWAFPVLILDVFIMMWLLVKEPIKSWQLKQKGLTT
jgi:Family of unknown function (DUF6297)